MLRLGFNHRIVYIVDEIEWEQGVTINDRVRFEAFVCDPIRLSITYD